MFGGTAFEARQKYIDVRTIKTNVIYPGMYPAIAIAIAKRVHEAW